MITPFSIARLPAIEFGSGSFSRLPQIAGQFGSNVLLVAGGKSFLESRHWAWLRQHWQANAVHVSLCQIRGEPSPVWVDEVVAEFSNAKIDVVIAIGGGSALDAGKAVAGLLRLGRPVTDYLEGVGPELPYEGPAVPFIAVPTTAGTGSEATKNAVLSVQGEDGYKKSFRSDQLIARYAVVDPELLETCPPALIAANGMDALTQLLESYVSTRANPFTDSLALSGLTAVRKGLIEWYEKGASAKEAQTQMAYASLLSGITLAQAGLGSVHGLASPLGAFFPIPHGVACGTLLAEATAVNIQALRGRDPQGLALKKYAHAASYLVEAGSATERLDNLVFLFRQWTEDMKLPVLKKFGVTEEKLDQIVANSRGNSMKTNPIVLTDDEISHIVAARI